MTMVIGSQQLRNLHAARVAQWIEQLSQYLTDCFPAECSHLGDEGTRQFAQEAIYRGRGWGFVSECDVAGFAAMFFLLSPTFDQDGNFPWVNAILHSPIDAPTKMQRLWAGAIKLLQQVSGR